MVWNTSLAVVPIPASRRNGLGISWKPSSSLYRYAVASCYPKGVCYCPHVKRRPFQARVWWGGRYWSLGYFASITEAEMVAVRVRSEIREWADMRLPPPTLQPLLKRVEQRQATPPAPADPASETPAPDPLLNAPQ